MKVKNEKRVTIITSLQDAVPDGCLEPVVRSSDLFHN